MNWSFRVVAIPWAAALFLVAGSGAQQPAKAETPAGAASLMAEMADLYNSRETVV